MDTVQYTVPGYYCVYILNEIFFTVYTYTVALCGDPPFLVKFEKIRIKVGLVLVAISKKTEYTD